MDNNNSSGCFGVVGSVLAVICSWTINHSVLWAILHALCSWVYVAYWIIAYALPKMQGNTMTVAEAITFLAKLPPEEKLLMYNYRLGPYNDYDDVKEFRPVELQLKNKTLKGIEILPVNTGEQKKGDLQ